MQLKVVSYNIHKGLAAGNRRTVLGRICDALEVLEPDIVMLQEVVDEHTRFAARVPDWSRLPQADFIARGLQHSSAYARNAIHSHGGHGNAVLSRFSFEYCRNVEMSVNRWEQRGMLHAIINIPAAGPVHAICVHLNLLQRHQLKQLKRLCQVIDNEIPRDEPLIIAGDFNDWRGKATRLLTERLGVKEATYTWSQGHSRTFPAWRPMLALDRIYTRNVGVGAAKVLDGPQWRRLSDHLPMMVQIDVNDT